MPDFAGESAPVMLLFADPFSTPMQDVLTVIEERYPDAHALGGLAGGGTAWVTIDYSSMIRPMLTD